MTQKARVLSMLKAAGKDGIRSDAFYQAFLPRAGARIWELRQEGYEILSTKEKQFVRYVLAGVDAESRGDGQGSAERSASSAPLSVDSSERSVPSMFDADVEWAA